MGVSVHINNTTYLSAKEAGRISGYTSDYVARLARQGKIEATRIGAQWFVEPKSLEEFLQFAETAKEQRKEQLRAERITERSVQSTEVPSLSTQEFPISTPSESGAHTVINSPRSRIAEHSVPEFSVRAHLTSLTSVAVGVVAAIVFASPVLREQISNGGLMLEARLVAFGFYSTFGGKEGESQSALLALSNQGNSVPSSATPRVVNGAVVVLPGTTTDATVEYVRDSFSDDVDISLDADGTTGIITPIFKDGAGDAYRFVVVPLSSTPP